MPHVKICELFATLCPGYAELMDDWLPNGKNSIRVRLNNHREYIFSYENEQDWKFETVKSFMRGNKK